MPRGISIILAAALVIGTTGCERSGARAAILFDRSASSIAGCESISGVASALIDRYGDATLHVTLFTTGDARTSGEPVVLYTAVAGSPRRVLEGRRRVEREQQQVLRQLYEACRSAGRTARSPIALAALRAAGHLHATGRCGVEPCILAIVSDGVETQEGGLARAVQARTRPRVAPVLIESVDISIQFCGLSQTTAGRGSARAAERSIADARRVERAWRAAFANPKDMTFAPACPALTPPAERSDEAGGQP